MSTPNPPRLVEQAHHPERGHVARLVRAVGDVPPLSPTTRERIAQSLTRPVSSPWPYRRLAWGFALLLVLGSTAAAAHYRHVIATYFDRSHAERPSAPVAPPKPVVPAAMATPTPPAPAEAPRLASPYDEPRPARPAATRAPRAYPEPSPKSEPVASSLSRESEAINLAMSALRREGSPARALRILDDYDRQFPEGTLRSEAVVLRVDALVASGDEKAALARMSALSSSTLAALPRLRLLRGELRARLGDCALALSDFDALLAMSTVAGALRGDALFGRGACKAKLGQGEDARADYQRYLESFSTGRHAGNARAALGR